ncbi:NYN domain-containing protein [Nocardia sp. BMG51109]|uniref:NYN domain-containing protein n=1 Tax=Nocardia sp. BMG51109 TaxID=1056816 RepID=UPI00046674D5|nr:NYN domain-containing protein [Nocardia sp. BMG51109]
MTPLSQLLVVDAANVVGSRPDGWWRDRAGAARRLLAKLSRSNETRDHPTEVLVVLEGAAKSAVDEANPEFGNLTVVLAPGSGDDTIVDVVATAGPRPITVVTADRALRDRVEALGATTIGPGRLLGSLDR